MSSRHVIAKMADGKDLYIRGHYLYVRKCETSDVFDEHGDLLLQLPDWSKDYSLWVEILGIGDRVATRRSDRDWKRYMDGRKNRVKSGVWERPIVRCMADYYRIGDLCLCPEDHPWGILQSPYHEAEFFIDETVPELIYREGGHNGKDGTDN